MTDRRPKSEKASILMVFAIILATAPGAGAASITDPGPDPLEGPFADAVLLRPKTGAKAEQARLLVLRFPARDSNGVSRLAVLERSATGPRWAVVAEHAIASGLAGSVDVELDDDGFILPLPDDRFVLVSPGRFDQTAAALLELTVDGRELSVLARTTIPLRVEAVGLADTDADGQQEIVLLDRPEGLCGDADARVIDSTDLHEVRQIRAGGFRTGSAVFGRFDARPGMDLAIAARRACAGDEATEVNALILSLAAPSPSESIIEVPAPPNASGRIPARPLAADVDGDGRDDLVTEADDVLAVRLAGEGWTARPLGEGIPIAAIDDPDGGAWIASLDKAERSSASMTIRHVALAADGRLVFGPDASATASHSATAFTADALSQSTPLRPAAGSWTGDVDLDGCQDLLVPRITLRCSSGGEVRSGPGWFATTPFAAFGEAGARRLLVAGTAAWPRRSPRLAAPTPAGDASAQPIWRDSASVPFLITDVAVGDLLYHVRFPAPAVSMGRDQAAPDELGVTIGGYVGERFFVRTRPLDVNVALAPFQSPIDFLAGKGRFERTFHRIPIAPGGESGARDGFISLPLSAEAAAHQVTVVGVNDWGEVSAVEERRIEADRIGPTLVVRAPLTSLPWPLVARIEGVADPGAEVRIGDGDPVEAARNGRFSIRTSLAPWPQTLDIRATDPAGNETVLRLSVVGGLDYRQLPWEIIIGAAVLIATLLAALRSPRRLAGLAASPHRVASATALPTLRGAAIPAPAGIAAPARDDPWAGHAHDAEGEPMAVIEDLD